jgi:hypothetical protein
MDGNWVIALIGAASGTLGGGAATIGVLRSVKKDRVEEFKKIVDAAINEHVLVCPLEASLEKEIARHNDQIAKDLAAEQVARAEGRDDNRKRIEAMHVEVVAGLKDVLAGVTDLKVGQARLEGKYDAHEIRLNAAEREIERIRDKKNGVRRRVEEE